MPNQTLTSNTLMKIMSGTFIKLPTPHNISALWNLGSLLSLVLTMQILTGLLLASAYSPSMESSFQLVFQTMQITDNGWLLRYAHTNGASLFFTCLYLHIGRGLYYGSFLYHHVWSLGVTILILSMATAFMGYVLPVNQMSFWGASVITNLFSEIPYLGPSIVQFLWGGPSVYTPTIMRFFTFHFTLPFIMVALVILHITFLHQTGSSNPLGLTSNPMKITFNAFLTMKDMLGVLITIFIFLLLVLYTPMFLGDNENFVSADPAVTPQHIQPEWYFLFAYAILRSVPNKLGGVIALLLSVMLLYMVPFTFKAKMKSTAFYPLGRSLFWALIITIILLTWIGARPVEQPYILTGQILTFAYFGYFLVGPLMAPLWDLIKD